MLCGIIPRNMHEWLLVVPSAVGFLVDRGLKHAFNMGHRLAWRRDVEWVAEGTSDWLAEAGGHSAVRQAEVQMGLVDTFRDSPERIASSRLCYLKGIAALVLCARAVIEFRNHNIWEAYQSLSIALPFMFGALFDGIKAGDLDPETVLNRDIPGWRRLKRIL